MYEGKENLYLTCSDLPSYPGINKLSLNLNNKEAEFLRKRILLQQSNSLLAYILRKIEKSPDFLNLESFEDMIEFLGNDCPLYAALQSALLFDNVMKGAYIRYNYNLSKYANEQIKNDWKKYWNVYLKSLSSLKFTENSFDLFFKQFKISTNTIDFCRQWIKQINEPTLNEKAIDDLLRRREVNLKTNERSRLQNPSLAQKTGLPIGLSIYGDEVMYLNYRFFIARRIIKDIYNGLIQTQSNGQQ